MYWFLNRFEAVWRSLHSYFSIVSYLLFVFQGIRGADGLPGPLGAKGEQVYSVKIVFRQLISKLLIRGLRF